MNAWDVPITATFDAYGILQICQHLCIIEVIMLCGLQEPSGRLYTMEGLLAIESDI